MTQVFAIAELRILILRELPMRELLPAQVVCPTWQTTIRDTTELQRLLFFRRAACGPLACCDWCCEDGGVYQATFGQNVFGPPLRGAEGTDRPKRYAPHWGLSRTDDGRYRVWANPLLIKDMPFLRSDGVFVEDTLEDLGPEWVYDRASWRRMLVTQPECTLLVLGHKLAGMSTMVCIRGSGKADGGWDLLYSYKREVWIEGKGLWEREEWRGVENMGRLVVRQEGHRG